jgi:uncharacterized zinc-type alcohol dehydrogenase-like protein
MKISAMAAENRGAHLKPWTYETDALGSHDALVKVIACGICHSDIHMIDNDWMQSRYPLVPGHEVVGEVTAVGASVTHLRHGDRVGIGWQKGSCKECRDCVRGDENLCDENRGLIVGSHGGFADAVIADARFCFPIPKGIPSEAAGPLLCGGVTVYAALRHAGMSSGQEIGVIGVGGLGHLAVQFAARLGNRVTVFTTSQDKVGFAAKLGASDAILARDGKPTRKPARPLNILINTVPANLDWAAYLSLLDSDGALTFVGVPGEPARIPIHLLLSKRRRVTSSVIGNRHEILEMLDIADHFGVAPIIETFPLSAANAAIEKIRRNTIRYRAVLIA